MRDRLLGARGVVGVNKGVWSGGGSEFRSTERSVARRVRGLVVDLVEPEEEVGEGFVAGPAEGNSIWIRVGNGGVGVMGELRTASRTGSNAGSGMIEQ